MPKQQYTGALSTEEQIIQKLNRSSKVLLWAKLLTFGFSIYFFYQFVFNQMNSTQGWVALLFLGLYFLIIFIDSKLQARIRLHENIRQTITRELDYLSGVFRNTSSGDEFINPKDYFSYDLDVFGEKSLFHRINRTISSVGRKLLAQRLSSLELDIAVINERQTAIQELAPKMAWRVLFLSLGVDDSYDVKKLSDNLLKEDKKSYLLSTWLRVLIGISSFVTISCIVLSIYDVVPLSFASSLFAIQLVAAGFLSKRMSAITSEVEGLLKGLRPYQELIEHIQGENLSSPMLQKLKNELIVSEQVDASRSFKELSHLLDRLNQRGNLLTYILFNGLVLSDVRIASGYLKWKQSNLDYMSVWINVVAELDVLVSMSTFAFNHPEATYPEAVRSESLVLDAKALYHPFLGKSAVPNDFSLDQNTFAIVTGANMAGKSTFLRSVGVNLVLAHNGLPVCASCFRFTPMSLFSSMRTTDNLVENISYFNAELIRLEQMIMYCKSNVHTLIILDEILKGTNSNDKLKGSCLLLRSMEQLPVSGIVATHDLELTELGKGSSTYFNYCFEIEMLKDIKYTYKMTEGIAENLNATFLLKKILQRLHD